MTNEDFEVILPVEGKVEIGGVGYRVKRLRLLELAALMRVATRGAGGALPYLDTLLGEDVEDIGPQVMGMVLVTLPDAVEEFVGFLNQVLEAEDGQAHEVVNPDVDEVLDVMSVIVDQEKDDIHGLVGKARKMWEVQVKPLLPTGSAR